MKFSSISILVLAFSYINTLIVRADITLDIPLPLQTPSFSRGVLRDERSERLTPRLPFLARQATCPSDEEGICPSSNLCCRGGETCCPHACCPSNFPFCSLHQKLCLNSDNLTRCTDTRNNETFAGTACGRGGCCGRDPNFPYCALAGPGRCIDRNGFFPCMINYTAMPGVACGQSECCPNPMKCCGDKCCNDGGTGGAIPIETVPVELIPGTTPLVSPTAFEVASSASPSALGDAVLSIIPQPTFIVVPATYSPNPTQLIVSLQQSQEPTIGPQGTFVYTTYPSAAPTTTPGLTLETRQPKASPSPSTSAVVLDSQGANSQTTGKSGSSKRACFPGSAMVNIEAGGSRPVSETRIGDNIGVGPGLHSKVFMWTHGGDMLGRVGNGHTHEFVRLTTESGKTLIATAGHFVYACSVGGSTGVLKSAIAMDEVRNGSHSLCEVQSDQVAPSLVVKVDLVVATGLFNPHTLDGNVVIDGFLCSCYTRAISGPVAHGLLSPIRAIARVFAYFSDKSLPVN